MPEQEDIDQEKGLLKIHRRNLANYIRQRDSVGPFYAPPGILNGIEEERTQIRKIKTVLSSWGEAVENLPGDEEITLREQIDNTVNKVAGESRKRRWVWLIGAFAIVILAIAYWLWNWQTPLLTQFRPCPSEISAYRSSNGQPISFLDNDPLLLSLERSSARELRGEIENDLHAANGIVLFFEDSEFKGRFVIGRSTNMSGERELQSVLNPPITVSSFLFFAPLDRPLILRIWEGAGHSGRDMPFCGPTAVGDMTSLRMDGWNFNEKVNSFSFELAR